MSNTHFDMGGHLRICYIFTEHLVLRTSLDDCFWSLQTSTMAQFIGIFRKKNSNMDVCHPSRHRRKLNVHMTFRRSTGRLLKVLCTLNLRPVSTGRVLNALLDLFQKLETKLTHSQPMFHFYIPWKHQKTVFWYFQEV